MFLQCRKEHMQIPKSSEDSLVFPFSGLRCRFMQEKKLEYPSNSRVPFTKIQQSLKDINGSCNDFRKLKLLRNIFWLLVLLLIGGVITGGALINTGLQNKASEDVIDDTRDIVTFSNWRIIAGAIIVGASLLVFFVALIIIIKSVRKCRIMYEKAVFEKITELNRDLKDLEIRWKIGMHLRWLEISFDYKKKAFVDMKIEDNSKIPMGNDFDPTNIQLSVL